MKAIEVKNLTVKFENQEVIKNVSFSIDEGNITALIGPNGAGKTTLLKAILGIVPYQGKIKIFGEDHLKMLSFIGYLPQHFEINSMIPLTVEEFLFLTNPIREKIDQVLKELDIENLKNKKIADLSGGQMERVLFARCLIHNPKILLLDEPISETDVVNQKEFYEIIKHLNEKHRTTILIVTHEITIVHSFAHQVLCLNHRLVCDGPITELFKEETLKELYQKDIFIYPFNRPIK